MKTTRLPESWVQAEPRSEPFAPRVILVPLDFSELSNAAFEKATSMAVQFGSKLVLVHVVEPIIQPVEYAIVPSEMEEINRRQASSSKTRLSEVQKSLESKGVSSLAEVRLGRPWQMIVEIARETQCDLIIIPTHGRSGFKHFVMGSTAERVVQHAPCPVLVVR